jgi:hypothetical protein
MRQDSGMEKGEKSSRRKGTLLLIACCADGPIGGFITSISFFFISQKTALQMGVSKGDI